MTVVTASVFIRCLGLLLFHPYGQLCMFATVGHCQVVDQILTCLIYPNRYLALIPILVCYSNSD